MSTNPSSTTTTTTPLIITSTTSSSTAAISSTATNTTTTTSIFTALNSSESLSTTTNAHQNPSAQQHGKQDHRRKRNSKSFRGRSKLTARSNNNNQNASNGAGIATPPQTTTTASTSSSSSLAPGLVTEASASTNNKAPSGNNQKASHYRRNINNERYNRYHNHNERYNNFNKNNNNNNNNNNNYNNYHNSNSSGLTVSPLNYFHDDKGNYFSSLERLEQAATSFSARTPKSPLTLATTDKKQEPLERQTPPPYEVPMGVDLLSLLPPEIQTKIIEYLSAPEWRALGATNLYFRSLCEQECWRKAWNKMDLKIGQVGLPPFQTAPVASANNTNDEWQWTFNMRCRLGERCDQSWRGYRDYEEVKLLDEKNETEVVISNNPANPLLVCTQDKSLLVAPFDSENTSNRCSDFHKKVKWRAIHDAHSQPICALRLTSNDQAITATMDGEISLWDLDQMKRERSYRFHSKAIETLDSFDDLIWSGGFEGKAVLCKKSTGDFVQLLDMGDCRIWSIRCNSSTVAIGTGGRTTDETLRMYDIETGKEKRAISGHAAVYDLQFEEDGTLISASYDSLACLWDFRKKDPCVLAFEDIADEPLYCLQRRGWKLAVGTFHYSTVRLWDFRQAKCLRSFYVGGGKRSPMYSLCFDDSKLFAAPSHSLYMLNFAC